LETTYSLPLEFKLFGVKSFYWEDYYTCLGGKLIEYFLTVDQMQEIIRTFLHEKLKLDKYLINKMFPFSFDHFEYTSSIIKENESTNTKTKQININDIKAKKVKIPSNNINNNNNDNQYNNDGFLKQKIKQSKFSSQTIDLNSDNDIEDSFNNKNKNKKETKNMNKNNLDDISKDSFDAKENLNPYSLNKGSNSFVISGKYTKSGKSILCNDPHLMNGIPPFWYIISLKIGSEYNFSGNTHPGLPIIFGGTNGHVSWE